MIPHHQQKRTQCPVSTPQQVLKLKRELGLLPKLDAPPSLILCNSIEPAEFSHLFQGARLPWPNASLWEFAVGCGQTGQPALKTVWLAAGYGNSSGAVVELVEMAVAAGVRSVINVEGIIGIDGHALGTVILCDRALRDDGISFHYLRPRSYAYPSLDALADAIACLEDNKVPFIKAHLWTCEAPYTITKDELEAHRHEGIVGVDRVSASLYAVAERRMFRTCTLGIIESRLTENGWEFGAPANLEPIVRMLITRL